VLVIPCSRSRSQSGVHAANGLLKSIGQRKIAIGLQEIYEAVYGDLRGFRAPLISADAVCYDEEIAEWSFGPGDAVLVFSALFADVALDANGDNH
jgi:hypothetical protein